MVLTESTMLKLATKAPNFKLSDVVSGDIISLSTFDKKKALLVMFICCHCPFVKHVQLELAKIGKDYVPKDVGIVAISSNNIESHPDDAPDKLKEMASELGFNFPYCFDPTQEVAKSYTAACTPDFYIFNKKKSLVYRGQFDDSRPENGIPVTGNDMRIALEAMCDGREISVIQKPSIGCNVKWKS